MRIKKIEIKNLFGMFDHTIPLNMDERITIIHGPNGFGKTITLTLIHAVFTSQYQKIMNIPFDEIVIHFDDHSRLVLERKIEAIPEEKKRHKNGKGLTLKFFKTARAEPKEYSVEPVDKRGLPFSISGVDPFIKKLTQEDESTREFIIPDEKLSITEIMEQFVHLLPGGYAKKAEPSWLKQIKESIDINFIKSERLLIPGKHRPEYEDKESPAMVPVVETYSRELVETIKGKQTEYAALSQKLDSTFPSRLVNTATAQAPDLEDIKARLETLKQKRARLMKVGILDEEKGGIDLKDTNIDEKRIDVLSVYAEDVEKKLALFDELTDKMELLKNVVNKRFHFKVMSIDKKEGFYFETGTGKFVPLKNLSSGEQHELVLLYEMLFKVKTNTLILIDEPEISLHVAWQAEFLENLREIIKMVGFDVLIATHSPDIIQDKWDLTVEFKARDNEK